MDTPPNRSLLLDDESESFSKRNGKNYLFLIGINAYEDAGITNLDNAVPDAQKMSEVLTKRYRFEEAHTTTLFDTKATRENILDELDRLEQVIEAKDSLLIYFAGHGFFRKSANIGYLVPSNARLDKYHSFLPNSTLRDYMRGIRAHHILLVVDSCFSGSLILNRELTPFDKIDQGIATYAERVDRFRSRLGMAAGRIEKVSDGWAGSHSPFARGLITFLENNSHPRLAANWLFQHVNTITTYNADQTPISGVLDKTLHDGGEFIFELRPDERQDWANALAGKSIRDFQDYLRTYPEGKHVEEAQWYIAQLTDTKPALRAYLDRFPKGPNAEQALDRLEYLDQQNRFRQAKDRGEASLRRFLRTYPNSYFAAEAKTVLDQLILQEREPQIWQAALTGGEAELQVYLDQFPDGPNAVEARRNLNELQRSKARFQAEKNQLEQLRKEEAEAAAKAETERRERELQEREARQKREEKVSDLLQQASQAEQNSELPEAVLLLSEAYQLAPEFQRANIQQQINQLKQRIRKEKEAAKAQRKQQRTQHIAAFFQHKATLGSLGGIVLISLAIAFWPEGRSQQEQLIDQARDSFYHEQDYPTALAQVDEALSLNSSQVASLLRDSIIAFMANLERQDSLTRIDSLADTQHIRDSVQRSLEESLAKDQKEKETQLVGTNPTTPLKKDQPLKPRMVRISGGTFTMGNSQINREKPRHKVNVETFYLAETEVTNAQFCIFLNEKGNQKEGDVTWLEMSQYVQIEQKNGVFLPKKGKETHPVIEVSWYGANAYCTWLGPGYRLPSEAEWEYAAGGGATNRTVYAGTSSNTLLSRYAVFNSSGTSPVASKRPVAIDGKELYDLSGNVWEWCQDNWHGNYVGAPTDGSAWEGGSLHRVLRGGSWFYDLEFLRVSNRLRDFPEIRNHNFGFRPARSL